MVWLVFMGWVISSAEWEDYSNYLGEGVEISRNWATAHFLAFHGWPQNCHGAGGCVIQLLMYYNERIMRLKVHRKQDYLPSWTQLVLTSFCLVLWLYHSFKGCAPPPSLLFHYGYECTCISLRTCPQFFWVSNQKWNFALSDGNSNFLRNHYNVFYSSYTILHSHQQCTTVLEGNRICHSKIFLWHAYYFELKTIKTHKTHTKKL